VDAAAGVVWFLTVKRKEALKMDEAKNVEITLKNYEWRMLAIQLIILGNTVPEMAINDNIKAVLDAIKQSGVLDGETMTAQMALIANVKYQTK
jgi:hypothetical protein